MGQSSLVFLDSGTLWLPDQAFEPLRALGRWTFHPHSSAAQCADRIRKAEVVVSNKAPLDAAAFESAKGLKLVCVAASGTNNVDLDAAKRRGICVCNVPGYAAASVAQHTITVLLNLVTQMPRYLAETPRAWPQAPCFSFMPYPIGDVSSLTLGLVGFGHIARRVAKLARGLGMEVRVAERRSAAPRPGRVAFEELLACADVVSLHCPLTPETQGLFDAATLARMKPGALLLNTARGDLLDPVALLDNLRSGHLGGAGIDTLAEEPPAADHPLLCAQLPNLLVTPHNAWGSLAARRELIAQLAHNITAFRTGTPRNVVSRA